MDEVTRKYQSKIVI
jgi:hypothetical protein